MLLLAKQVYGTSVEAADGKLGKLEDFLFDDRNWNIRELVVNAGTWLNSRRVTLPPDVIKHKDWADHRLAIEGLTRKQVLHTPFVETHVPLGELPNLEEAIVMGWEVYWISSGRHPGHVADDPHLHGSHEVAGYHIQAADGPIGHVADFVIDDQTWTIRYLAVDTRNWWPGKHVLISPARIDEIDEQNRRVQLLLSRGTIEQSPQYDASQPLEFHRTTAGE